MAFLSGDVQKIIGIKKDRLQQWLKARFVVPSINEADGPGDRNLWSKEDLYSIAIFKQITEAGWSRKVAAKFYAQGVIGEDPGEGALMVYLRKGERVTGAFVKDTELDFGYLAKELDMKAFDDCYIINFYNLKKKIDEKIKEHYREYLSEKK